MLHVVSMRSTAAVPLPVAFCTRVDAYRPCNFPRAPSTAAGRSRFECRRHHHDLFFPTSARKGSSGIGDKLDDPTSSSPRRSRTQQRTTITTRSRTSGVAMSIVSNCLNYARERPRLVAGTLCAAAASATSSYLNRCGDDLPRRFKAPFIFLAVAVAGMCVVPGAAVATMANASVTIPATQSLCLFGLAIFVAAAVRFFASPARVSTEGLTCATGIGVALPYRGTRRCIYLDYNATSPIFPEVTREMFPFIGECFGNPSSAHALGRACKAAVVKARERVAALLGCAPEEVVFVATGSEADNHAILAALALHANAAPIPDGGSGASKPHVVSSAIEHPAITKCLDHLASEVKLDVTYVGVDEEGRVSIDEVAAALRPETALVTIMHSNNEVGSLQPIKEIAALCRRRGILCHTDAAQSIGKVSVKVSDLGVDMLTLVGHKFGAPKGVAALFVRKGLALPPMIHGGGQESGRRAGTENVLLISGMGKAAEIVDLELERLSKHLAEMRARLLEHLEAADLGKGMRVHGPRDPSMRLPNTLSVGFPGLEARELLERLSETVAASAGSACHAGEATMSGVLQAMGVEESTGFGTVRLSVGRHTTRREVDTAAAAIVLEATAMLAVQS